MESSRLPFREGLLYREAGGAGDPLEPLLSAVAEVTGRGGLRDYERLHLALAAGGPWTLRQLRQVAQALLARSLEESDALIRFMDEFFPRSDDAESPGAGLLPGVREAFGRWARGEARPDREGPAAAGKGEPVAEGLPGNEPDSARGSAPMVDSPQAAGFPQRYFPPDSWVVPPRLKVTVDRRPLPPDAAPELGDRRSWPERGPLTFPLLAVGGRPAPWFEPATLDELAELVGYFLGETSGRRLDVNASIRRTLRRGVLPELVFERRRQVRMLLILEDERARAGAWNTVARELAEGLALRGVPVLQGRFGGAPDRFVTGDGRSAGLEDFEDERSGCVLLVFTDGARLHGEGSRFVFEALSVWPQVAWMDLREPRDWDEVTARARRHGVPVFPATSDGVCAALRGWLTETGGSGDRSSSLPHGKGAPMHPDVSLEVCLGDAYPWARDCAVLPAVSWGLADDLRRRFHPHLSPERLGRLLGLPGTHRFREGWRWSEEVCGRLRNASEAGWWPVEREREVGEFVASQIDQALDLPPDSLAALEKEAFSLEVLKRLSGDRPETRERIERLQVHAAGTPLAERANRLRRGPKPQVSPPDMVWIPPGEFDMGDPFGVGDDSERPVHRVFVSGFFLGRCHVTWEEWQDLWAWGRGHGYDLSAGIGRSPRHPVTGVSWYDALKGANARSEREGLTPVYREGAFSGGVYRSGTPDPTTLFPNSDAGGYRLPTEGEWEKAARGGLLGHQFPWESRGRDYECLIDPLKAQYARSSGGLVDVGWFPANGHGLHDMAGNAMQWVWDAFEIEWYQGSEASPADPWGPASGRDRVVRGGSWLSSARALRCASRVHFEPSFRYVNLGFRLARGLLRSKERDESSTEGGSGPVARDERTAGDRAALDGGGGRQEPAHSGRGRVTLLVASPGLWIDLRVHPGSARARRWLRRGRETLPGWVRIQEGLRMEGRHGQGALLVGPWRARIAADSLEPVELDLEIASGEESAARVETVGVPSELVLVPGGPFDMGDPMGVGDPDERPVHRVEVSPFLLDRYPVTWALWTAVRAWALEHGYEVSEGEGRAPGHPVTHVNWFDAVKWANARSERGGLEPVYWKRGEVVRRGKPSLSAADVRWEATGYRLPTEAEWEKAARGGLEGEHYPWKGAGRDFHRCIDRSLANYGYPQGSTSEVTRYPPNGYDLHDMTGNVWEWTWDRFDSDWYRRDEAPLPDTVGPSDGLSRVVRGGSWKVSAWYLRCANRRHGGPSFRDDNLGFRLARGLPRS